MKQTAALWMVVVAQAAAIGWLYTRPAKTEITQVLEAEPEMITITYEDQPDERIKRTDYIDRQLYRAEVDIKLGQLMHEELSKKVQSIDASIYLLEAAVGKASTKMSQPDVIAPDPFAEMQNKYRTRSESLQNQMRMEELERKTQQLEDDARRKERERINDSLFKR